MPRPRFDKLEAPRRAAILCAAAEEFAEHGFEGASYNRIIEQTGLSKGAMYYYFDDKEDLFVTTLNDAVRRLIVEAGNVEAAPDADGFWVEVEAWYGRSLRLFQEEPAAIGLLRTLLKRVERGTGSAALASLRDAARGYLDAFIASGQAVGAIRTDLPDGLLRSVLLALEEGIDLWLADRVTELGPDEIDAVAATLTGVYRRVAAPLPGSGQRSVSAPNRQKKKGKPR